MKRAVVMLAFVSLSLAGLFAQDKPDVEKEKAAIRQAALDYAEGYYEGSAERMERALHPLLMKRGLIPTSQPGGSFLVQMNSEMLVEAARSGRGKLAPEERKIAVKVLDLTENTASAEVFTSRFNDFLHLAKVDGRWRLVNVLWCPPVPQPTAATEQEREAIVQTIKELREGANAKDAERVRRVIHPEMAKRTYASALPGGKMIVQELNDETLLEVVRMGRAVAPPDQPAPDVTVLDVYENIASLKVSVPGTTDYMHLAKQGGQWRIVNGLSYRAATPPPPTK
jgi:hypothetical protein